MQGLRPRALRWRAWLVLTLACGAALQLRRAWYLEHEFEPTHTEVAGLALAKISPRWVLASELSRLPLPPEASEPGQRLEDHGAAFERTLDLDGDGSPERALVGVSAASDGARRRFLLIVAAQGTRAGPLALFEESGGFSALRVEHGALIWASCLACDGECFVRMKPTPHLDCGDGVEARAASRRRA